MSLLVAGNLLAQASRSTGFSFRHIMPAATAAKGASLADVSAEAEPELAPTGLLQEFPSAGKAHWLNGAGSMLLGALPPSLACDTAERLLSAVNISIDPSSLGTSGHRGMQYRLTAACGLAIRSNQAARSLLGGAEDFALVQGQVDQLLAAGGQELSGVGDLGGSSKQQETRAGEPYGEGALLDIVQESVRLLEGSATVCRAAHACQRVRKSLSVGAVDGECGSLDTASV